MGILDYPRNSPVVDVLGPVFLLMVLGILVDTPHGENFVTSKCIPSNQASGHHRKILFVVLLHPIPSYEEQIWIVPLEFLADFHFMHSIVTVVYRICLGLTRHSPIDRIAGFALV